MQNNVIPVAAEKNMGIVEHRLQISPGPFQFKDKVDISAKYEYKIITGGKKGRKTESEKIETIYKGNSALKS
jgi:hypothetical protein